MAETPVAPTATAPVQGTTESAAQPNSGTENPNLGNAPAAPEKDQFAEKLELLSRKERAVYREKQRVAAEKRQIAQEKAEYDAWKAAKAKAKENPLDYLSKADLSYDALTQFMLNGGKPTAQDEVKAVRGELEAFKKQQEEERQRQVQQVQAAQKQAEAQALESFQEEIGEFIEQNKSTYELISTRDAAEDVFTTIQNAYQATIKDWIKQGKPGKQPQPMSIKEASDLVEEFYEKEVERLAQTQKMKAKFQPQAPAAGQKKGPSPTLTNSMNSSSAASLLPAANEADRMARALAKLG